MCNPIVTESVKNTVKLDVCDTFLSGFFLLFFNTEQNEIHIHENKSQLSKMWIQCVFLKIGQTIMWWRCATICNFSQSPLCCCQRENFCSPSPPLFNVFLFSWIKHKFLLKNTHLVSSSLFQNSRAKCGDAIFFLALHQSKVLNTPSLPPFFSSLTFYPTCARAYT